MKKRVQEMSIPELRAEARRIAQYPWSERHADVAWELAERKVRS